MMKMMKKTPGMMGKMAGMMGLGGGGGFGGGMGGGQPSAAELEAMQKELAQLDPQAIAQLPKDVQEALKALPKAGQQQVSKTATLPGLGGGLPGLGGGRLPGLGGPALPKGPFPFGGRKK